jgi:type IV secretion system protein VirD4
MMIKYAILLAVVITLAAVFVWAFLPARYLPGNRVRSLQLRLHLRLHPGKGFATILGLWLRWSRLAALRRSGRIRRSLPLWLRALAPGEHSVFLGRAHWRHGLRVPLEEHVLVMAPPRTFKTAFLADVILRYPGPVIATTTKADIFGLTAAVRSQRGPVHVFNPQYIGAVPSTFSWSPVSGCEDPATAIRRADAFAFAVSREGVEDGSFWSAKASDYLRGYFHAAALAGYDMRAVAAWVSGADPHVPEQILTQYGARQWALTLAELRSEAHKTTATVRMVMSRALSFMADPALAASVLPAPGQGFDIPSFLRDCGTVYMVAEAIGEDAPVAPLFAAMATEIHYVAALMGQASESGRLDPPLLMGLDEVTQICPVPLPSWLSDSGGKGIQVIAVVHGEAQLAGRWEDHGRQIVWDTSSVKVFLPGITDTTTLQAASTLCGQASWKVHGQDHPSHFDIATPDMIRQLPAGFALVIRGGYAPVIARLPRAWNNRAYRRARRRGLAPAFPGHLLPLSAEPETAPDLDVDLGFGFGTDSRAGTFPDYPPPGWAVGDDDRSFPWS